MLFSLNFVLKVPSNPIMVTEVYLIQYYVMKVFQ
jgi:hypothetical protein